ncbi:MULTISPECIES: hypothetical protein [unclassified Gilliamella]|nr:MULTISPECIES: hypothetical protein [unclassified Gilliamella]
MVIDEYALHSLITRSNFLVLDAKDPFLKALPFEMGNQIAYHY